MNELNLIEPIQRALKTEGYTEATDIQIKAIPALLKGEDLLGCAQTGTGKTAAFAIPILQGIAKQTRPVKGRRPTKALVVAPTRELAIQIADSFKKYGRNLELRTTAIYGGVAQGPQTKNLGRGIDIIVATPGRLLDLINQGHINLKNLEYFVLDEADLMLDMGMLQDVRKILKFVPKKRQTMFFSATMPEEIEKLSKTMLNNPVRVVVTPVSSTVEIIKQSVYYVDKGNKTNLLIHLLKDKAITSGLVFARTKHGSDKIVRSLVSAGIKSEAIHGNKSQNARQLALDNFKKGKTRILVATDIAARGIDIVELSHVFNYNLSEVPETYVHRIGRTGRASLGGTAISFCAHDEKPLLKDIQKLIGKAIPEVSDHPYPLVETVIPAKQKQGRRPNANPNKNKPSNSSRGNRKPSSSKKGKPKGDQSWGAFKKTNTKSK